MVDISEIANRSIGLNEGEKGALMDYLTTGGQNLDPQETAWCAAWLNSTMAQAGIEGTGSNMARSFLEWGEPTDSPKINDVVVFSRGDPAGPYGHTGLFQGYDENGQILVLGGNQSDGVNVSPYDPSRLLGFRTHAGLTAGSGIAGAGLNEGATSAVGYSPIQEKLMRGLMGDEWAEKRIAKRAASPQSGLGGGNPSRLFEIAASLMD